MYANGQEMVVPNCAVASEYTANAVKWKGNITLNYRVILDSLLPNYSIMAQILSAPFPSSHCMFLQN
jgi:hypothetical protein